MKEKWNRTNNRKMTEVICHTCGKLHDKPLAEYKRNIKLDRKMFCSRTCAVIYGNKFSKRKKDNIIKEKGSWKKDNEENSPFRSILRSIRQRYKEFDITLEDLKEQWFLQNGYCVYSNIKLKLASYKIKVNSIERASLDRIDSSKGYIKGNIQFVSTSINYMKGQMSHEDTIKLINLIKNNGKELD